MLCSQHTKGVATTQRQTGLVERIVCTAVEHTAYVAHAVQAVDDVTVSVQCLAVGVGVHAAVDGGHADVLADTPEGSLLDLVHVGALLAEVRIGPLIAQLVVAVNGLLQLIGGHVQQSSQLLDVELGSGVDHYDFVFAVAVGLYLRG